MIYMDLLGFKCKDVVTGFEGVVESISYDLYGCVQAAVKPKISKDTKAGDIPKSYWFDAKRLKVVGQKPILKIPNFSSYGAPVPEPGPVDKSRIKKG